MRSLYARPLTVSLLGAGLVALCVWAGAQAATGPEATTAPATAKVTTAPTTATVPAEGSGSRLPLRSDRSQALPTLPDSPSSGVLGRMMAYVIVILLLGGVAMVLAKRFLPRFRPAGAGGRIRVVDNAYLGPRKQLHVVQIGSQRFLLASCRDSVTMISELASTFADALEASQADGEAGTDASAGPADGEGRA